MGKTQAARRHQPVSARDRILERIWPADDCMEWTGNRNSAGYGQLRLKGRMWSVHRLIWTLHFGPIPDGLMVLHGCDNPACVEIDHLLLGTRRANVLDRQRKGRGVVPKHQRPRSS